MHIAAKICLTGELGLGSSLYVNGYRVGMLLAGSGGLILADHIAFGKVYWVMALIMLVGVVTTLFAEEPEVDSGIPKNFQEAVVEPFAEYLQRNGAVLILLFILLYKVGDQMASTMTMPFYLDLAFTKTEVAVITKLFGFWATILGGLAGGIVILHIGILRSLWIFGFLQALSTAGFSYLAWYGKSLSVLAVVIGFENLGRRYGNGSLCGLYGVFDKQEIYSNSICAAFQFDGSTQGVHGRSDRIHG